MQHPYIISQQSPSHTDRGEESISSAVRVMAFRRRSWLPLALALVLLSCIAATAMAKRTGELTVFWGRNKAEGTLRAACDTGLYNTVIISFFSVFGHGRYWPTVSQIAFFSPRTEGSILAQITQNVMPPTSQVHNHHHTCIKHLISYSYVIYMHINT